MSERINNSTTLDNDPSLENKKQKANHEDWPSDYIENKEIIKTWEEARSDNSIECSENRPKLIKALSVEKGIDIENAKKLADIYTRLELHNQACLVVVSAQCEKRFCGADNYSHNYDRNKFEINKKNYSDALLEENDRKELIEEFSLLSGYDYNQPFIDISRKEMLENSIPLRNPLGIYDIVANENLLKNSTEEELWGLTDRINNQNRLIREYEPNSILSKYSEYDVRERNCKSAIEFGGFILSKIRVNALAGQAPEKV